MASSSLLHQPLHIFDISPSVFENVLVLKHRVLQAHLWLSESSNAGVRCPRYYRCLCFSNVSVNDTLAHVYTCPFTSSSRRCWFKSSTAEFSITVLSSVSVSILFHGEKPHYWRHWYITSFILFHSSHWMLSTKELMLLNCGVGEDSWESLGLQGISN